MDDDRRFAETVARAMEHAALTDRSTVTLTEFLRARTRGFAQEILRKHPELINNAGVDRFIDKFMNDATARADTVSLRRLTERRALLFEAARTRSLERRVPPWLRLLPIAILCALAVLFGILTYEVAAEYGVYWLADEPKRVRGITDLVILAAWCPVLVGLSHGRRFAWYCALVLSLLALWPYRGAGGGTIPYLWIGAAQFTLLAVSRPLLVLPRGAAVRAGGRWEWYLLSVVVAATSVVVVSRAAGLFSHGAVSASGDMAAVNLALNQPGACVFVVDASVEIIAAPNSFCEEGTTDTVKGTHGNDLGPFRVSTSDQVHAASILCSLTRPTDDKRAWVASATPASGSNICSQLIDAGWR